MKLNFQAGSSPLASRHNPVIYSAIFVGIIIIFIAIIIWFLLKKLDTLHQTEEWIEKQKDRPTKKSDVIKTARKYNFTDEETNLLWKICHKFKANNIFYNFKSSSFLYDLFFNGYQYFSEINDQASLSNLFNLKFKIEKIIAESSLIKSSHLIPLQTKIFYLTHDSEKISFTLIKNHKDYLVLAPKDEKQAFKEKYEELTKMLFTFISSTGMHYGFVSRLIRYEQEDDKQVIIISHPTELYIQAQRHFKRIRINEDGIFFSAKQNNDTNKAFIPGEKKYPCKITNISGGGCCLSTKFPIKEGQYLFLTMPFINDKNTVLGKIVKTRNSMQQGLFNLHIHFEKIPLEIINKIQAEAHNFENSFQK